MVGMFLYPCQKCCRASSHIFLLVLSTTLLWSPPSVSLITVTKLLIIINQLKEPRSLFEEIARGTDNLYPRQFRISTGLPCNCCHLVSPNLMFFRTPWLVWLNNTRQLNWLSDTPQTSRGLRPFLPSRQKTPVCLRIETINHSILA